MSSSLSTIHLGDQPGCLATLEAARTRGVAAALWARDGEGMIELAAQTPAVHTLSFQLRSIAHCKINNEGRTPISGGVGARSFNLTRAGETTSARVQGPFRTLHVYIADAYLQEITCDAELAADRALELIDPRCSHDIELEQIVFQILREMTEPRVFGQMRLEALSLDLVIQLARRHSNIASAFGTAPFHYRGGLAPWAVRRVADFCLADLSRDIALTEMAALVELSPFHFCRAFKASTGLPPHKWLGRLRMMKAQDVLQDRARPITDIAFELGYASHSAFGAAFRREIGVTPKAWREVYGRGSSADD